MSHREFYACAAEVGKELVECVKIAEGECFFTDTNRSLCKYIPGEAVKKVVFERKYPGYTIAKDSASAGQTPPAAAVATNVK